jgi:cytochrome oxidase Cu insertion factor (SCO1/SenC/PrrC family)
MNVKKSSFTGYMLFAVFIVPLLIAIAMYVMRGDSAKTNAAAHGELIHPAQPIETMQLRADDSTLYSLNDIKGKWTYFLYIKDSCNLECEAALFKIRQTRISTGRERNRVRLLLATDSDKAVSIDTNIKQRNSGVIFSQIEDLTISDEVAQKEKLQSTYIYIIDPNGNLMMKYDDTSTSKSMLRDIKKLLKLSNIG